MCSKKKNQNYHPGISLSSKITLHIWRRDKDSHTNKSWENSPPKDSYYKKKLKGITQSERKKTTTMKNKTTGTSEGIKPTGKIMYTENTQNTLLL